MLGSFGGVNKRDFTCIQSLDGVLTFFEQEVFVFCCFLPEFLLPGPIVYVPRSDLFVTMGSDWNVHAYRYVFYILFKLFWDSIFVMYLKVFLIPFQ